MVVLVMGYEEHRQRRRIAEETTQTRGGAANEENHEADGHCKCRLVSGIQAELLHDKHCSGGGWGTGNLDS